MGIGSVERKQVEEIMGGGLREETMAVGGGSGYRLARPAMMLRVEGLALLCGSVLLYWLGGGVWWLFALLLFAPDVSMLGYLFGSRVGAAAYNVFHAYPLPAVLVAFGLLWGAPLAVSVALAWFAHIGMDRLLGYGFKYASGFGDTHLGRV